MKKFSKVIWAMIEDGYNAGSKAFVDDGRAWEAFYTWFACIIGGFSFIRFAAIVYNDPANTANDIFPLFLIITIASGVILVGLYNVLRFLPATFETVCNVCYWITDQSVSFTSYVKEKWNSIEDEVE